MSGYIEKERPGQFFNPISSTVEINPEDSSSTVSTNQDENLARWDWLISGWNTMSFKQRMAIFMPYTHYINLRDSYKVNFDEDLNSEIVDKAYELCREVSEIKFDPDRQGIPNILVIYSQIYIDAIPDATIKNDVLAWGEKYHFIKGYNCYSFYNNEDIQ